MYMTNRGHMPLTTNYGWMDSNSMWTATGTKLMAPSGATLKPQSASAVVLNPGETLAELQPSDNLKHLVVKSRELATTGAEIEEG